MCWWCHHPGITLYDRTVHMRVLRLIVWYMLDQRLTGELLRAVGNILCGVSGRRGGDDGRPCRGGRVHHGALMVLLLSLLGHIWYCRRERDALKWNEISWVQCMHLCGWSTRLCDLTLSLPFKSCLTQLPALCSCSELFPQLQACESAFRFTCGVTFKL